MADDNIGSKVNHPGQNGAKSLTEDVTPVSAEKQEFTLDVMDSVGPFPTSLAMVDTPEQLQGEKAVETLSVELQPISEAQVCVDRDSVIDSVSILHESLNVHDAAEKLNIGVKEIDRSGSAEPHSAVFDQQSGSCKDVSTEVTADAHPITQDYDENKPKEASSHHEFATKESLHMALIDEKSLPAEADGDATTNLNFCKVENGANSDNGHNAPCSTSVLANDESAGNFNQTFQLELSVTEGCESGTDEEQVGFRKDVESFYRNNGLEFKAPKFYKEELNLLKLWRAVIKLGGYEQVTSCKLWRQVGESFRPPKTCTTVSWTFRIFYEKALLEYERHKLRNGELPFSDVPVPESLRADNQNSQTVANQALGSGRARRDAAARAMQGWHSQRLLDNGEVCHPVIKEKTSTSATKVEKQMKTNGLLKRKNALGDELTVDVTPMKSLKSQSGTVILDVGAPAEWVKVNVQKTVDCYEIYALVPGLLREEVHVQSDPAGRVIISGQPGQVDNPWGIIPFKKVVSLPTRIDPHNTSAVVTLHGQLFVRVPFEPSN